MPQVSIIIPAYNQEKYISECLNSVIKQTLTDWECIVVNDGSTDSTKEIVLSYADHYPKIRMIEQSNKGLSSARNTGLRQAKGAYIQFLDSDDAISKNKLKVQLDVLTQTTSLALSYTDYYYSVENDLTVKFSRLHLPPKFRSTNHLHDLISKWENKMSIPIHCFLFDSKIFKEYNLLFDEKLINHEDWDFLMNLFRLNPIIFYIDQKLAIYRLHESSMARYRLSMKNGFLQAIRKQQLFFPKNSTEQKLLARKRKQVLHSYSLYKLGRIVKKFFPRLSLVKVKYQLSNCLIYK